MSLRCGIFDWVEASGRAPAEVYEHKLELASAAERAGFHGIFFAEHHGTPLSIDGSPTALLSAVFQRTRHLRAGALTFCLPWYHPYRFYSEVCMLDQMSHGRLELGVGRGVSPIESRIFGLSSIDESRERYRSLLAQGWTDSLRTRFPGGGVWTFWDYQAGAWQRDAGFRIDHLLLSPLAADRFTGAGVDKDYRGREKASDHAPTWVSLR